MTSTLLLTDPYQPDTFTARTAGRLGGHLARLRASSLDRELAVGRSPESSRLLAIRAQRLVCPDLRAELARDLEHLLTQAHAGPSMRSPRAPLNRAAITSCEPQIRAVINALLAPLPVPASGPAMVSRLLSDGSGPVYHRRRSADLQAALTDAAAHLDPVRALVSCG
jgi:hypothetical protein